MNFRLISLQCALIGMICLITISGCKKEVNNNLNVTPTCTDGIKNGTETGVDCGGSCTACVPPTACFTTGTNNAVIAQEIIFGNCSTGGTSYLWNFGDGQTSTDFSPTHRYLSSGNKQITLQVSNADTTVSVNSSINIAVNSATYAGSYTANSTCTQVGTNTYDATISPSGSGEIIIYNFYNLGEFVRAEVFGNSITISNQGIFGLSINGTGTLSPDFNTLTINYTIVGGPTNDNCTVVYTRK